MFDDSSIASVRDLLPILDAASVFDLGFIGSKKERAQWIYERLVRFAYRKMKRKEKGILTRYLCVATGCTDRQIRRHIKAYRQGKKLCRSYRRRCFSPTYTQEDRELLAELDNLHGRLSAEATKNLCGLEVRAGDGRYARLQHISQTHLYRFRDSPRYRDRALIMEHTKPTGRAIGERRKPDPDGKPGYLRVDTVHQGDRDGEKGVYHINLIDVITQWEVILSVEQISEKFLKPILQEALSLFPFIILGFHSDNGSEFINDCVSRILRGLGIEQTKSRPRKCNDNALVESKNGAIIRKWLGHHWIPRSFAARLNVFHREHLIPYVNFIRPCAFPTVQILPDGKRKVTYKGEDYKTPFEKLCSLDNPQQYLKPGITMAMLEQQARKKSPNTAARDMQEAKRQIFELILQSEEMS
jgi:hypothetical protein